jgi:hypothetical protein
MPPLWWPLDLGLLEGLTTLGFLLPLASFLLLFSETVRVGRSHDPHLSRLLHPLFLYCVGN